MSHAALIVDSGIHVPALNKILASVTSATHLKELLCNCAGNSMFDVTESILKDRAKFFCLLTRVPKKEHTHTL